MAFIDKADVKGELRPDGSLGDDDTTYDTYLTGLCTYVLSLWDEWTNRVWASDEFTEYHDSPKYNSTIKTKNYPITEISSIHDDPDWDFGDADLVDSSDYTYGDGTEGIVNYEGTFHEGKQSIKIVYTAGYSDDTVPGWLKQILIRQVCHWYKQAEGNRWDHGGQVTSAGSINYYQLKNNLLPDFMALAERHSG